MYFGECTSISLFPLTSLQTRRSHVESSTMLMKTTRVMLSPRKTDSRSNRNSFYNSSLATKKPVKVKYHVLYPQQARPELENWIVNKIVDRYIFEKIRYVSSTVMLPSPSPSLSNAAHSVSRDACLRVGIFAPRRVKNPMISWTFRNPSDSGNPVASLMPRCTT